MICPTIAINHQALSGLFRSPEDNPPKWLFMLRAYLDESGQQGTDYVFVCGHVGSEDAWRRFIPKWNAALGPQRKRLHLHDLRWSKHRTRELLAKLGPVPTESGLSRVIGGARVSDYADLVAGSRLEKILCGYAAAMVILVLKLLAFIPKDERVEIVFEAQDRFEAIASRMLNIITQKNELQLMTSAGISKLAKWSFVPKGSTMLLDQADYLAYALAQKYSNPESKRAQWCSPILATGQSIGEIASRNQMRSVVSNTVSILFR